MQNAPDDPNISLLGVCGGKFKVTTLLFLAKSASWSTGVTRGYPLSAKLCVIKENEVE